MTSITIYCLFDATGQLQRVSAYTSAEAALADFKWPPPEGGPGEMYACRMSENAAVEIREQKDLKKATKMCKLYSHSIQKCADIT